MRTSTVVLLVVFLCIASSRDRQGRIKGAIDDVKRFVHDVTAPAFDRIQVERGDSQQLRTLKAALSSLDEREEQARRSVRAVDRCLRTLEDRIDELDDEGGSASGQAVALLQSQRTQLLAEREQLTQLQDAMKNERIQLKSAFDLAAVRSERRQVEDFLSRERGNSPLDRLEQARH